MSETTLSLPWQSIESTELPDPGHFVGIAERPPQGLCVITDEFNDYAQCLKLSLQSVIAMGPPLQTTVAAACGASARIAEHFGTVYYAEDPCAAQAQRAALFGAALFIKASLRHQFPNFVDQRPFHFSKQERRVGLALHFSAANNNDTRDRMLYRPSHVQL
jgi:hypothetical protein